MIYKESKDKLLKENLIKRCPVDHKAILDLIKRAYVDLKTAKRNLDEDEECAFNYAYNAMLRSGLALMFSEGLRPDIKDKHLTIVRRVAPRGTSLPAFQLQYIIIPREFISLFSISVGRLPIFVMPEAGCSSGSPSETAGL